MVIGRGGGLEGAAGAVGVMGQLSVEELAAWVEASCVAQGVGVKVSDPAVVRAVCALLSTGAAGPKAPQRRRGPPSGASEAPEGSNPGRVEALSARDAWSDDGVVEDGGDDGGLAGEVEPGPLGS